MTIADKRHNLLFGVRRSVRYHNRRRNYYDRFNLMVNAVSVIMGSATVYGVLHPSGSNGSIALIPAFIVTVLSAFNLVIGSARQARLHSDLAKRFIALEKKMVVVEIPEQSELNTWTQERLDIEMDEPPVLHVLNTICHNEVARSMGYGKEYLVKIGFCQRMLSPVFDIGEHSLGA